MEPIQYQHSTLLFRETALLRSARERLDQLALNRPLRILSFGCSVGDEIATIRWIFPDAEIVGCDIDDVVLAAARKSVGHMATILRSDEQAITAQGPYDLILACSVLCLNPLPKDFAERFPPSRFDALLGFLDSVLRVEGILAISNASYRFIDSPVAERYQTIRSDVVYISGFVDIFDRETRPILRSSQAPVARYFRKTGHFAPAHDEELADSLFQRKDGSGCSPEWVIINPPPSGLQTLEAFERSNVDGVVPPEDVIEIITRCHYSRDPATGEVGILRQHRWKSLVHEGDHVRPETWSVQSTMFDALR